ncbi:MAG: DNA polymerase III subunit delta' C-terminal domain-containing protein [bacterium]
MSWDNIIGQRRVIETLKRTISNNRIPHAYLFTGPDGAGKHLAAKELAKTLNCKKNTSDALYRVSSEARSLVQGGACDVCSSCYKINKGIHPDVQVISPEGKSGGIKIEQIYAIRERIFLKPLEGRYKFYIIDRAERLIKPQEASGNALLKLLEEPPNDTIFVLIPTENQVLIPTIVSRCQKIKFDYLSISAFRDEKSKADRDEVFNNFKKPFLKNFLNWAKELSSTREKAIDILDIMILCLRDILVYKITNKKDFLANADYFKEIEMAQKDTIDGVLMKMGLIQKTKRLIEQNINLQLALDVMFMEMVEDGGLG